MYVTLPKGNAIAIILFGMVAEAVSISIGRFIELADTTLVPDLPPYASLVEASENAVSEYDRQAIEADIPRSAFMPGHALEPEEENGIRRMLLAWVVLRPEIGYAQSLNFIAALALAIVGDEEVAFKIFAALVSVLGLDFHSAEPPLLGFHVEVDVLLRLVPEVLGPAFDPATAADVDACNAIREALRPWCCRVFLPLWVSSLPVDVCLGVWHLLLEPEPPAGLTGLQTTDGMVSDGPGEAVGAEVTLGSTANLAVALAVLQRISASVLETVAADPDHMTAYGCLLDATATCFSEPEGLIREAQRLRPSLARVQFEREHARWRRESSPHLRRRSLLHDMYEASEAAGRSKSKLTAARFAALRRALLDDQNVRLP